MAETVAGERGPPPAQITFERAETISKGAILRYLIPRLRDIATGALHAPVGLTPGDAGLAADWAHKIIGDAPYVGVPQKRKKGFKAALQLYKPDRLVLNDIATAAVQSIVLSGSRKPNANSLRKTTEHAYASLHCGHPTPMNTLFANLRGVLQAGYVAAPGGVAGIALEAAKLAAERAVAYPIGMPQEYVRAVIAAASDPERRRAAQRALGRRAGRRAGGKIAYSYGVDRTDNSHQYRLDSAGYCGHAHPLAILKYEAHGWRLRYNASTRSRHEGPEGDRNTEHPKGHTAIGWDAVHRRPLPTGGFNGVCGTCNKNVPLQM